MSATNGNGKPAISVVIPTVDRVALLERTLRGLEAQDVDFEAIVVHDGNEAIKALLTAWRHRLPLRPIQIDQRQTVPKRNAGWRAAKADIIAFTDDDCEPAPGWLKGALEAFEQTPHAANLGWEVLLTPDEETGSHGTRAMFEAAAKRNHFGFVFEPARPSGDIIHSRKGTGGMVVTCRGRAAHAAKVPQDGRSAIRPDTRDAVLTIQALEPGSGIRLDAAAAELAEQLATHCGAQTSWAIADRDRSIASQK